MPTRQAGNAFNSLQHLAAPQLLTNDDLFSRVDAMDLEHVLGDIQTDRGNLHVDRSLMRFVDNDQPIGLVVPSGHRPPHHKQTSFRSAPALWRLACRAIADQGSNSSRVTATEWRRPARSPPILRLPDPKVFGSGRDFAAWIGLVPREDLTGGKQKLGPISKRRDCYFGDEFLAVKCAVLRYARHKPEKYPWLTRLLERKPFKVVAVALANKMARIAWALLARGSPIGCLRLRPRRKECGDGEDEVASVRSRTQGDDGIDAKRSRPSIPENP